MGTLQEIIDAPVVGKEGVKNWGIYDLDSKPDDSLLELPRDDEGYYLDSAGGRVAFNGNRELRPAYNYLDLNEYHIKEIIKCRNDLKYFMFNYIKVLTPSGYETPDLRDYQERYLRSLIESKKNLLFSPRQTGKSVSTGIKFVWSLNFYENVPIGIAANGEKGAIEVLDKVKKMFNELPLWMQQGVTTWNVKSIKLENGSKAIISATNGDAFRGFTFAGGEGHATLYVDECAFIPRKTWDEFSDSVMPTVSSDKNANIVITSTPNGYNHWYDYVTAAQKGDNGFTLTEVQWNEPPGRDEEWRADMIADIGMIKFNQNYGNQFLGSSETLIGTAGLEKLSESIQEPIESNGQFYAYSQPRKGAKYVMTVDLASGTGFGDYQAVHVMKINKKGFEQVGVFHANDVPLLRMTAIIHEIALKYNSAYVLFEINYGEEIASRLYRDIEYENVLTVAASGTKQKLLGFRGTFQVGLKTTRKTKQEMLIALKTLIESGRLIVRDRNTVDEFFTFTSKGESFEAEPGSHDDLVMSMAMLGWLVAQDEFKDIINYDFIEDYSDEQSAELYHVLPASMFGDSAQLEIDDAGL